MFTLGENILKQRVVIAVLEDGEIGLVVGIVCPNDDTLARNRGKRLRVYTIVL